MTEPNSTFEALVETLLESARFRYSPKLAAKRQAVLDAHAGVREDLNLADGMVRNYADKIASLESAYAGVAAERDALQTAQTSAKESSLAFWTKIDGLESYLDAAKATIERITNERDAAEEALAELRADPNAELKAEIERLKDENEWITHLMKRAGFNVLKG
jgi:chromosome segregation ATPase